FDNTAGLTWTQMTNAQRVTSAINTRNLAWNGANVSTAAPQILASGTPLLTVTAPASAAGNYQIGLAQFGAPLFSPGVTSEVMPVVDNPGNIGLACTPLSPLNAAAVSGKIALVDRGVCGFTVKVKTCQDAGAIGVIIVDNVAGSPPAGIGGTDPTIVIPSAR